MKRLVLALLCLLPCLPAQAADTPDYLVVGGGSFDYDKHNDDRHSVDYRAEYEWGASLLPMISDSLNSTDAFMQVHPTLGVEGTSNDSIYPNGGFDLDVPFLWRRGILTWGEAVGFFGRGNDPRGLGSITEFRSQLELGVRFDNDVRVTGYLSHISNAHLVNSNPGAEIVGAYLHLPLYWPDKE